VLDDSASHKNFVCFVSRHRDVHFLAQLSYDVDEGLPTDCCIAIGNFNSPEIIQQNYISQSIHTCMGC
jgi:hypothetical protein